MSTLIDCIINEYSLNVLYGYGSSDVKIDYRIRPVGYSSGLEILTVRLYGIKCYVRIFDNPVLNKYFNLDPIFIYVLRISYTPDFLYMFELDKTVKNKIFKILHNVEHTYARNYAINTLRDILSQVRDMNNHYIEKKYKLK